MSFLPYGGASSSGWFGAFGVSAVLHGGAVLGVVGLSAGAFTLDVVPSRVAFTVTLDQLDADTLAGLIEQEGVAGSDSETPNDTSAPALAETAGEGDLSGDAQTSESASIELPLEVPTQVQPETLSAQAAAPEVIAPSPIILETVMPLSGTAALGAIHGTVTTTTHSPPAIRADDTIITNLANLDTAQTVPAPPPAPPTAQDLAVGDLIARIRAVPHQICLIALPRRDGQDGIGLALIASQDSAMEVFAQAALTAQDTGITQTRTLIDSRQCPTVKFVERNAAYPAMRLGIQIDTPAVASGGTITGVLRGVGGRYLTLVLVDDNGVVTNLQRFTSQAGNIARFDVPVTRVGLARDTSPLILAIATDRPMTPLVERFGMLATDVFLDALTRDFGDASLGLVTIDIR